MIPFQVIEEEIKEMNLTDPCQNKSPLSQAVEDAVVVATFTLVSALVALGWPPVMSTAYVPCLSAGLVGIVTYMKARKIQRG